MDTKVFVAVLFAAILHAGWNAVVKTGLDRFLSISLIALAGGAIALPLLLLAGLPARAAWPYLAASGALHVGYNIFLVQAYRTGDFGQVYPIARGAAPLLVSFVTILGLGEMQPPLALAGIAILATGIALMSFGGGRDMERLEGRAIAAALTTSAFIAGYTLSDGFGARLAGSAHTYALWLFAIDGISMLAILLVVRGRASFDTLASHWRGGIAGGLMSLLAYWIVIWAMTQAPIPLVAALRETSVLFAALLSILVLHERPNRWRVLASLIIVAGVILVRIG